MPPHYLDRPILDAFLTRLGATFVRMARLYLIGETTQLFEGWREWTQRIEFTAEVSPNDRAVFDAAMDGLQSQMGVAVFQESPGDVIPLPDDYGARARPAGAFGRLDVYHFDPYSVAFRLIARGDEPDYQVALAFLERGWMTVDEMQAQLADLLPRFSRETIQQDPAEFRRKFKGLLQMWRAAR